MQKNKYFLDGLRIVKYLHNLNKRLMGMYKKRYYNFVVVFLLVIISLVAGTSMGLAFNTKVDIDNEFTQDETQPPSYEVPDTNQTFNGLSKPSASANTMKKLEYAAAVVNYGAGYISETIFDVDVLGHNQYAFFKRHRGENYDVVEEWYKMTGMASGIGSNQFNAYYTDGENFKYMRTRDTNEYSYEQKTYEVGGSAIKENITKEQFLQRRNGLYLNDFILPVNKKVINVTSDDKGRGKEYYTIKGTINGEILKEQFLGSLMAVLGSSIEITIDVINITFRVDKQTGFMMGYDLDGMIYAKTSFFTGSATLTYKEKFLDMNKSAQSTIMKLENKIFGA
jgi:hypothetical protein